MVVYLLLAFTFLVISILTIFDKIKSNQEDVNAQKKFKLTLIIMSSILSLAMILFMIAEIYDVLYLPFNVIGLCLIIGVVIFYFTQDYLFRKIINKESENKHDN